MAKKIKEVQETPKTLKAYMPIKHADGNVSIESVYVSIDEPREQEVRPIHPLVACDSLFGLIWDQISGKQK